MRKFFVKPALLGIVCLFLNETASSQPFESRKVNINDQWAYLENSETNVNRVQEIEDLWQPVQLPHTWNSMDATDNVPGYRRNAGWYRKNLSIELQKDQRYFLYFEGSNITTDVYINGNNAGGHVGGYLGFEVEITPYLKAGNNELLVRVDNSYNREIIPSYKSDFFIFGGITRDVWLKTVPLVFLNKMSISTPVVSAELASTEITAFLNGEKRSETYAVKCEVRAPGGSLIFESEQKAGSHGQITFSFQTQDPELWDVTDPDLYQVTVNLINDGQETDQITERYGYRWFEFKDYGAFYLNGERLLLRGTHRHEEHAGYGAAMPNELHIRDMKMIKEMGANFVRLGHYPQDPEVYRACDELGLIVWDELPWCRGGVGNEVWKQNTRNMLKEMIDQNRNHPSIMFWSLGNEIYWLPDFEDGDNVEKLNVFLKELNDLAHEMDPSRLTSIRKYYEGSEIPDVFSPSIWAGWYSGNYKSYEKALTKSMREYPHFIHAEYGGGSHVGRHSENPITGDGIINPDGWEEPINQVKVKNVAQYGDRSENYIVDLFDWHLKISETMPDFGGNAQWAFKDFATPLRPENDIPYMNQKGLMDREGRPKDAYYVFKSYWSEDPFCYIESATWTERNGPEGKPRNLSVYSSCEEVAFFHNTKSLGRKKKDINAFPASGLTWEVNFKEGNNQLIAVGFNKGKKVAADTLLVSYSFEKNGAPEMLTLSAKNLSNGNLLIEAFAVDLEGRRCLDYEEKVYFQCLGGGVTLKNRGTPTGSEVIAMANGRAAIEVIPEEGADVLTMTVLNQDFKGTFLEIPLNVTP